MNKAHITFKSTYVFGALVLVTTLTGCSAKESSKNTSDAGSSSQTLTTPSAVVPTVTTPTPTPAPAAVNSSGNGQACTIAGTVSVSGKLLEVRDCIEMTTSVSADELKQGCEGLAKMGGGKATISYSASCPAGAKTVCKGMGNSMDVHYYKRAESVEDLKKGCVAMGGKPA
jgi:hypothetical protein